ncbi:MAG TPA: serine acetyltransferase [Fibrobacteres bacterium]|jgi:serine O-acetyltransferase|nr:serine acetyltransferase [Fibrobacterota bacterium]
MRINDWMNSTLPDVVAGLEESIVNGFDVEAQVGLDLSGRQDVYKVLDDILAVLFPGSYGKEKITREGINFFLSDTLRHVCYKISKHLEDVLRYRCKKENCDSCTCENRAEEVMKCLVESLPQIRAILLEDIQAAFEGDPAARYIDEIVLGYPCVEAISTYRIAHLLYDLDVPIIPRIMSERAHSRTGIDIHPGAIIGPRFFIDHGTGVVIGETTTIGRNVKLYQGVTLGALSPFDKDGKPRKGEKRHPDIEDDVIIYANATILGGRTVIGKGAIIGGNTWITKSVEPGKFIYTSQR